MDTEYRVVGCRLQRNFWLGKKKKISVYQITRKNVIQMTIMFMSINLIIVGVSMFSPNKKLN